MSIRENLSASVAFGALLIGLSVSGTAMAQTDSLVERVVEALESLQSAVLEPHEERAVAAN